jgi:hypothetical protein
VIQLYAETVILPGLSGIFCINQHFNKIARSPGKIRVSAKSCIAFARQKNKISRATRCESRRLQVLNEPYRVATASCGSIQLPHKIGHAVSFQPTLFCVKTALIRLSRCADQMHAVARVFVFDEPTKFVIFFMLRWFGLKK